MRITVLLLLLAACSSTRHRLTYEAEARTITGDPFGQGVTMGDIHTGHIEWSSGADTDERIEYANYDNVVKSFEMTIGDLVVTGSGIGRLTVTNSESDGIQAFDGPEIGFDDRFMMVDGTPDETVELFFAIFDEDGTSLGGTEAPKVWTFETGDAHTFSVEDDQGTILHQLTSMSYELVETE